MRKLIASALLAAAAVASVAGCSGTSHHVNLRYNPDGVQLICQRSQVGMTGTVTGDGRTFNVVCDQDGRIGVWDVTS